MVDWERHEWELTAGRSRRIADDVVGAVRRTRRRRHAIWAAALSVAAIAVAVPVVIETNGPIDGTPLARSTEPGRRPAADAAEIYAAVLGRTAGRTVTVIERACAEVPERPSTRCDGTPIPQDVQARVRAIAGPSVRFVAAAHWPSGLREPAVVGFGELSITGHTARLGTEYMCGPLCGSGEMREFQWRGGHWVQTRQSNRWVS